MKAVWPTDTNIRTTRAKARDLIFPSFPKTCLTAFRAFPALRLLQTDFHSSRAPREGFSPGGQRETSSYVRYTLPFWFRRPGPTPQGVPSRSRATGNQALPPTTLGLSVRCYAPNFRQGVQRTFLHTPIYVPYP